MRYSILDDLGQNHGWSYVRSRRHVVEALSAHTLKSIISSSFFHFKGLEGFTRLHVIGRQLVPNSLSENRERVGLQPRNQANKLSF